MSDLRLLAIETSSATGSVALALGDELVEQTIATPREQTDRVLTIVDELLEAAGLRLSDLDALVFGRGPGSFTGLRIAAAVCQGLSLASGLPIVPVSSLAALAQRGFTDPTSPGATAGPVSDTGLPVSDTSGMVSDTAGAVSDTAGAVSDTAGEVSGTGTPRARDNTSPLLAFCCLDARMGEVYSGLYRLDSGVARAVGEERISGPEALAAPEAPFIALGDGFAAHGEALAALAGRAARIDAGIRPRAQDLLPQARLDFRSGRFVPLEAALPVYLRGADAWRKSAGSGQMPGSA